MLTGIAQPSAYQYLYRNRGFGQPVTDKPAPLLKWICNGDASFWEETTRSSFIITSGWGLIDLPLRTANETLLRGHVARAEKIIRFHPLSLSRFSATNALRDVAQYPFLAFFMPTGMLRRHLTSRPPRQPDVSSWFPRSSMPLGEAVRPVTDSCFCGGFSLLPTHQIPHHLLSLS